MSAIFASSSRTCSASRFWSQPAQKVGQDHSLHLGVRFIVLGEPKIAVVVRPRPVDAAPRLRNVVGTYGEELSVIGHDRRPDLARDIRGPQRGAEGMLHSELFPRGRCERVAEDDFHEPADGVICNRPFGRIDERVGSKESVADVLPEIRAFRFIPGDEPLGDMPALVRLLVLRPRDSRGEGLKPSVSRRVGAQKNEPVAVSPSKRRDLVLALQGIDDEGVPRPRLRWINSLGGVLPRDTIGPAAPRAMPWHPSA